MFRRFIKSIIFKRSDVPISSLVYSDEWCYRREGFGGKPLKESPLYRFFYEYLHGDQEIAFKRFCSWYTDQFIKYGDVDKRQGGMQFGTLYSFIAKKHLQKNMTVSDAKNLDPNIVTEVIAQRVAQRFALADNIAKAGYTPNLSDPIIAVRQGGKYILYSGHHRCCILAALGKTYCAQISTPKNIVAAYIYIFFQKLKWLFKK